MALAIYRRENPAKEGTMKAKKEKTSRAGESSIYRELKTTEMNAIDQKIHDLLIAEGYRVSNAKRFDGMKLNNYTNVNRMEYIREGRERVFVITNEPGQKKGA